MKPFIAIQSAADLRLLPAVVLALVSVQSLAARETCETRSATTRVTVLELYTSEAVYPAIAPIAHCDLRIEESM